MENKESRTQEENEETQTYMVYRPAVEWAKQLFNTPLPLRGVLDYSCKSYASIQLLVKVAWEPAEDG